MDEAYLTPGAGIKKFEEAALFGLKIKDEILGQEGITCSVGIGPNKLLAKIASGSQKPDGLIVVRPEDVKQFLFPLPVTKLPGIGEKTADILKAAGITYVEQLANCNVQMLSELFGKMGLRMKQIANGLDFEEVQAKETVKSISRHRTFHVDTNDPLKIRKALEILTAGVHNSLLENHFLFKTVTLTVCFEDFSTYMRSKTLPILTSDIS